MLVYREICVVLYWWTHKGITGSLHWCYLAQFLEVLHLRIVWTTLDIYDIPTGSFAVSCSVFFNIIVNILRRYLQQSSIRFCFSRISWQNPFNNPVQLRKFQCTTLWKHKNTISFSDVSRGSQKRRLTKYGLILCFVNIL